MQYKLSLQLLQILLVSAILTYSFSGNEPLLYTSTQCLGPSMHVIIQFYQALCDSARDIYWGEILRRPGYGAR